MLILIRADVSHLVGECDGAIRMHACSAMLIGLGVTHSLKLPVCKRKSLCDPLSQNDRLARVEMAGTRDDRETTDVYNRALMLSIQRALSTFVRRSSGSR